MSDAPNPTFESFRELLEHIPHQQALGFELLTADADHAIGRIPYAPELVGNPAAGIVHGGVVTTLLDTVGGIAVFSRVGAPVTIATLDLRIDYLRPSPAGEDILARVECYKLTSNVAFTRGIGYNRDPDDPLASMSATYMLHTPIARRNPS